MCVAGTWSGLSFARTVATAGSVAGGSVTTMVGPEMRLPAGLAVLRHGDAARPWRLPSWRPDPTGAVSVTTPGDVAVIDARDRAAVTVSLYVTNLPQLRRTYRSFALPVAVWQASTATTPASWRRAAVPPSFLTDDTGRVQFDLPGGRLYELTLEAGGSIVTGGPGTVYAPTVFASVS